MQVSLAEAAALLGIRGKVQEYRVWKQGLIILESVLGGEPVFPGSRLAVRRIGGLANRGEPLRAILEDYSYLALTVRDVQFAMVYTRANPRRCRVGAWTTKCSKRIK